MTTLTRPVDASADWPDFDAPTTPEEARLDLEAHALMDVIGGDEPQHVRAFLREVSGPAIRPRRRRHHAPRVEEHAPVM